MKCTAGEEHVELIPESDFEREQLRRVARYIHLCCDITTKSAADSSAWPFLGPTGTVLLLLKTPPPPDESELVVNLRARIEREKKYLLAGKQIMLDAMNAYMAARGPDGGIGVPYDPLYVALSDAFRALPDVGEGTIAMAST